MTPGRHVLTMVTCGAGPATAISICVKLAQDRGWTVQVIATPAALDFLIDSYPWHLGLDEAERMLDPALPNP